ncbi:hypothetical protein GAMM_30047 [Gammaproteobacteria bacterium]
MTLKIDRVKEKISDKEADIRNLKDTISLEKRDLILLHEKLEKCTDESLIARDIQNVRDSYKEEKTFKNSNIAYIQKRENQAVKSLLIKIENDEKRVLRDIKNTENSLKKYVSELELMDESLNSLHKIYINLLESLPGLYVPEKSCEKLRFETQVQQFEYDTSTDENLLSPPKFPELQNI